jgi:hypothetical protein
MQDRACRPGTVFVIEFTPYPLGDRFFMPTCSAWWVTRFLILIYATCELGPSSAERTLAVGGG